MARTKERPATAQAVKQAARRLCSLLSCAGTVACPAQAIMNVNTAWRYADRDQALHFERCKSKVINEFAPLPHVGHPICGVCIRVCLWERRPGTDRFPPRE